MLKIDVIKFEAQDVITTSVPYESCGCTDYCIHDSDRGNGNDVIECNCTATNHTYFDNV